MRQIKFRFRVENTECPVSKSYFEYKTLEDIMNYGFSVNDTDYEIVGKDQFTGLLDKNGREIYEGDIVKYNVWEKFREECHERIMAVQFSTDCAGFAPMCYSVKVEDAYYNYEVEDLEVIGNIYENPELLK